MLKVSGHLRGQHHVNNGLSQRSELVPVADKVETVETSLHPRADRRNGQSSCGGPVRVLEDVALAVSDGELEGQGGVVALQHGCVVVQDGQLAAGVAQEGVGPARVVHVVHRGCYQGGHLVQLVQTALNETEEKRADVRPPPQCDIKEALGVVFIFK